MARGVLVLNTLIHDGKPVYTCTINEAYGSNVPRTQFILKCNSDDPEFIKLRAKPPEVREAGEKLYGALTAEQAGLDFFAQTTKIASGPGPVQEYPLYVRLDVPDAENLPWEILWEAQKTFMVLDPQGRWPIARLASASQRARPLHRLIGKELRIAVVLAAALENGADEWASISAALGNLATPVDVLGLVSEDAAQAAINADAAKWQGQAPSRDIEVEFTGDSTSLIARLRAHAPNVIHFFCHGIADGQPQLELETRADRKGKKDRGSITLDSNTLNQLAQMDSLWLVVLNCCQGAKTAPQLHSLANELVTAGVPAVVAMRESVRVIDANLFTAHFYPDLFTHLQAVFALRNVPAPPDPLPFPEVLWVRAVHGARRQLSLASQRKPDSSAEWTYPVVYVHSDELVLHPRELKAATLSPEQRQGLNATLDLLRALRAPLAYATDAAAASRRSELDAEIQQIEAQLAGG